MTHKPEIMWGLFNFDTLWGVFHRHQQAITAAVEILGSQAAYERHLKDGSVRIARVMVSGVCDEALK